MGTYHKKSVAAVRSSEENTSLLHWILMGFTLLFFLIAPFSKGLFLSNRNEFNPNTGIGFQGPLYTALTFIFIALLLAAFFYYFFNEFRQKTDYLLLLVWLIPLSYFIAVFQGVSVFMSLQGAYLQMMYAALFLIGAALARRKLGATLLSQGLFVSGYVIVIYGLLVWLGNMHAAGIVINDGTGIRLTSVFTYANTYAGYLLALILGAMYLSASSVRRWGSFAHAVMLVPAMISLFLTLSRGGLILLPVFLLVILLFMSFSQQLRAGVTLVFAGVGSLAITTLVTDNGTTLQQTFQQGLNLQSWAAVIGVSVLVGLAAVGMQEVLNRYGSKFTLKIHSMRFSNLWLPGAAVVLGGLLLLLLVATPLGSLLPENVAQRIQNINFNQHSVLERGFFYLDALKIFKDYPLFGTGSGGWSALYQSYQSYPYTSRQSHNFFVQVLDDVGLFGSIITFGFILIILYLFVRSVLKTKQIAPSYFAFFILVVALLGHALIDFDMSYAFISGLVYVALGGLFAASRTSAIPADNSKAGMGWLNRYRWLYPSFVGLLAMVMLVVSYRMYLGHNKAAGVLSSLGSGQTSLQEAVNGLDEALQLHPSNTDYALLKVNLFNQVFASEKNMTFAQNGEAVLQKIAKRDPFLIEPYDYRYNWAMAEANYAKAAENAEGLLTRNPWQGTYYERAMAVYFLLGDQARAANKQEEADKHWNRVSELYQQVLDRQADIAKVPEAITVGNQLPLTPGMMVPLAQVQFARGQYAEAAATLQPYLNEDLENQANRAVVRYYLAALIKQGTTDQGWYDKLIAIDANEKQLIEQLTTPAS